MKLTPIAPTDALTIEQIFDTLKLNGIEVVDTLVPAGAVSLVHHLNEDEFENIILAMIVHHEMKPQNPNWCPGTPTGESSDYGYYICPNRWADWNDGDFEMLITSNSITWC
jgi:hypothetical protein